MKDEDRSPIEPADEEELRSAAALARALDGGPADPDLPHSALETAALLRLSAGQGQLSDERREQIRRELLASLPPISQRRRRSIALPRWLVLALPLGAVAVLSLLVLPRDPQRSARFEQSAASPAQERARQAPAPEGLATEGLAREAPVAEGFAPMEDRASELQAQAASGGPAAGAGNDEAPSVGGVGESNRRSATGSARDAYSAKKLAQPPNAMPTARPADVRIQRSVGPGGGPVAEQRAESAIEGFGSGRSSSDRSSSDRSSSDGRARTSASSSGQAAARGSSAAPTANLAPRADGDRRSLVELGKKAGDQRTALLARVNDRALSSVHAEVDVATSRTDLQGAQRTLGQALETLGAGWDPTDARLVRQDLYCRLAETALRLGEPRAALEWTRRGLELEGAPTTFLAQLFALEGDAWSALGDDSRAAGSYLKAMRVHETLLGENLDGR